MAQQVNPDLLYQRSREDLLLYEDARFTGLTNGTANFYLTKNDQSIWGAFLRALAKEIARLEYDYAYDLVGKQPQYLTPPDIQRRWATPLFISGAYPAVTQSDLAYRQMLVELLAAYKEGATVKAIQDVIFAYTGIKVVVQELYTLIGDGVYDISDTNAIKVSVNVGGTDPLTDITTLNELQLIVSSLYSAIDLTKPAHVGLEFTTVFGSDENIGDFDEDISESPEDGISDNLTILFRLIETPPFNPMLYQAPILDPTNPTTTVAPYGRQFAGPLLTISSAQWAALPSITFNVTNTQADGINAIYTYNNASYPLADGMQVTIQGCTNDGAAFDVTAVISGVTPTQFVIPLAATLASHVETGTGLVTPTLQSAYIPNGAGGYTIGMANWAAGTPIYLGQIILDTNGNTQMAIQAGTTGGTMPTFTFTLSNSAGVFSGSTVYTGTITGGANNAYAGRTFTVTGFTHPGNNGSFYCLASSATTITLNNLNGVAEVHAGSASVSAWSLTLNGSTDDNTVIWRMVGVGQIYNPSYQWIQLLFPPTPNTPASLTNPLPPTGQVGNWDVTHPIGLVAPRLNQSWEISGGDNFQSFEMN